MSPKPTSPPSRSTWRNTRCARPRRARHSRLRLCLGEGSPRPPLSLRSDPQRLLHQVLRATFVAPGTSGTASGPSSRFARLFRCPRQCLFPTARGGEGLPRPRQCFFPAARGGECLPRPRQSLFPATRGRLGLQRPRQCFFPAARGGEGPPRPWQCLFPAARGG